MEVKDAVVKRSSIRAFQSKPVPKMVLERIIERALWAPSWGNTEAWGFSVVNGKPLELIKKESFELYQKGVSRSPELTMPTEWNKVRILRYKNLGKGLFEAL